MSSRLRVLYKCLNVNESQGFRNWLDEYDHFTEDIYALSRSLNDQDDLKDVSYQPFSSLGHTRDYNSFIRKLVYEQSNGISSRGQSSLSKENLKKFSGNPDFRQKIKGIIQDPSDENYAEFCNWWREQNGVNFNQLLINRIFAACNCGQLSTMVDETKFNQVFNWLQKEEFIPLYSPNVNGDNWLTRNSFLMQILRKNLGEEVDNPKRLNLFVWQLYESMNHEFALKKQTVRYGAPGTGKTYISKREARLSFDYWKACYTPGDSFQFNDHSEIVQFHPSVTYEDFIEGLRPVPHEGKVEIRLQNGVFKSFCAKAARWERDLHAVFPDKKGRELTELTIKDVQGATAQLQERGKHWDYVFALEDMDKKVVDVLPPYYFLIDEINRAELSRVFGELMFCLEYRGIEGAVKTQFANLNTEGTALLPGADGDCHRFFVPSNVYILATMNTIDRSVESFDFALRRRFHWQKVKPDYDVLWRLLPIKWKDLIVGLEKLNCQIAADELLGEDYCIGHAYLMNLGLPESTPVKDIRAIVWENEIRPLLEEYLRGTGDASGKIETFRKAFWQ
jgi:5-methylcytosine-specific restriction protein B